MAGHLDRRCAGSELLTPDINTTLYTVAVGHLHGYLDSVGGAESAEDLALPTVLVHDLETIALRSSVVRDCFVSGCVCVFVSVSALARACVCMCVHVNDDMRSVW